MTVLVGRVGTGGSVVERQVIGDALAALEQGRQAGHPFALILTDAHMPEYDGFQLVEMIVGQPGSAAPTVIMLTSGGTRGDAARCRELGIAGYLTKPVRQCQLRDTIVRVLAAKSQGPGPRQLVTRHSLREEQRTTAAPGRTALHILLAEDNLVNQKVAERLVAKRGHSVVVVGNGREALAALEQQQFDLVLMDVQMPEMDGFDATAAIRAREKSTGIHLPIVAMTAHALKGDEQRCLDAGMDGYLSKPIKFQELTNVLDTYGASAASSPKTEAGSRSQ